MLTIDESDDQKDNRDQEPGDKDNKESVHFYFTTETSVFYIIQLAKSFS